MKRMISVLLILCLLLPAAALGEEKLPSVRFPDNNYVGYLDTKCVVSLDTVNPGNEADGKILELRGQNGVILGTLEYKTKQPVVFRMDFDEELLGGHDLSVWCGEKQISINSAYLAIGDRHRKAVVKAETPEQWISITIICAEEADQTDAILDVLKENGVKATFFLTGAFVLYYPEAARKIRDAGHEIGCGGWTNSALTKLGMDLRFTQVRKGSQIIREQLGVIPRLFSPPFHDFDASISAPARAEGMEVVLYTINSMDSAKKYANDMETLMKRITEGIDPGTIIGFHLEGRHTVQMLADALPYYRDTLNLTVVPVSELITSAGIEIPPCPYDEMRVQIRTDVF